MKLTKHKVKELKKKFPQRIPCVVLKNKQSKLDNLKKNKFLVPEDITIGQFIFIIRKNLTIKSSQALFLFCNKKIIPNTLLMSQIFKEQKNKKNYLEFEYMEENVFG